MPETSLYTDLLLPEDVKLDALNALNIDVTDTTTVSGLGGSYKDAAITAIRDVTDAIESYLDRKLIVRKWDEDIEGFKWNQNRSIQKYQYYPNQYPIVQVETTGVDFKDVRLLSPAQVGQVTYYAGYKRREQTLGDDAATDLDNHLPELTELPENLPSDIRRVAFRLVMYELTMAKQNTFATASVTKTAGNATAEITKARSDVYGEELSKLHSHRRIL